MVSTVLHFICMDVRRVEICIDGDFLLFFGVFFFCFTCLVFMGHMRTFSIEGYNTQDGRGCGIWCEGGFFYFFFLHKEIDGVFNGRMGRCSCFAFFLRGIFFSSLPMCIWGKSVNLFRIRTVEQLYLRLTFSPMKNYRDLQIGNIS